MAIVLSFDENLETYISRKGFKNKICVTLTDSLYDTADDLTEDNKIRIIDFIEKIDVWHQIAVNAILDWVIQNYKINAKKEDLRLMNIFILFDKDSDELYGLEFRAEFDIEHGVGLKINTKNNFEIIKIGTGDVSFC